MFKSSDNIYFRSVDKVICQCTDLHSVGLKIYLVAKSEKQKLNLQNNDNRNLQNGL